MKRRHLFEIEDQSWCPQWLRISVTEYLRFTFHYIRPYARIAPRIAETLRRIDERRCVDLCGGSGGSWPYLLPELLAGRPGLRVSLTDKYPNFAAWENVRAAAPRSVDAHPLSVDATAVPRELRGFRTLFTAFHHFDRAVACAILADAVREEQAIGVFEFTHRSVLALALMAWTGLLCMLVTPFMRPLRPSRLFWTYVVPLIPFVILFDGLVSCLRTYSPDELRALAAEADPAATFVWDVGTVRSFANPVPVTYLIGYPKNRVAAIELLVPATAATSTTPAAFDAVAAGIGR